MAKAKTKRLKYSDYYGFNKVEGKDSFPEGTYLIDRYREGSWLLELRRTESGQWVTIGMIDLQEVLNVEQKPHFDVLKKAEFYDALERFFNISLQDQVYATADVETVLCRFASHSRQKAISRHAFRNMYRRK